MVDCAQCKAQIPIVFLEKLRGTYMRDAKGKKYALCSACQRKAAQT